MLALLILALAWAAIFVAAPPVGLWWTGLLWVGLAGLILALGALGAVSGAKSFHRLLFIAYIPTILILFDAGARVSLASLGRQSALVMATVLLTIIAGILLQRQEVRHGLRESKRFNVESGRLTSGGSVWDIRAPLHLEKPDREADSTRRWHKAWRVLSPLLPGVGFALARNLSERVLPLLVSYILFAMAIFLAWGAARHLGIAAQISEWEQESGRAVAVRG
jgi:hypothetical protein